MVFLYQERGTGKTCTLIKLSAKNNIPIGVPYNARYIKGKAAELNLQIPEPIVINSFEDLTNVDKIYIDDLKLVIKKLFPCDVQAVTMSVGERVEGMIWNL